MRFLAIILGKNIFSGVFGVSLKIKCILPNFTILYGIFRERYVLFFFASFLYFPFDEINSTGFGETLKNAGKMFEKCMQKDAMIYLYAVLKFARKVLL